MAKPPTSPDLCPDHEHAATECARKNGHDPDGAIAARIRTNLAIACTPGRWCPPIPAQENP